MNDERRYDEEEIDRILRLATETGDDGGTRRGDLGRGLTLRELQEIGEEVGIARESIAHAASAIEGREERGGVRRLMGVPVGARRIVDLPRPLTDLEWERLVVRLRRTFDARGHVESDGRLRQWWNGNLQVHVEPGPSGYQLRLQTFKGSLRPMLSLSAVMIFMAIFVTVSALVSGSVIDLGRPAMMAAIGLGAGAVSLGGLPGWARLRARQMDEIAATTLEWTELPPPEE